MRFTVKRESWLRGEGSTGSRLLRSRDGKMCCLGFFAVEAGLSPDQISDRGSPGEVAKVITASSLPVDFALLVNAEGWRSEPCSTDHCCRIMEANDKTHRIDDEGCLAAFEDPEREADLRSLFSVLGHEVEFV